MRFTKLPKTFAVGKSHMCGLGFVFVPLPIFFLLDIRENAACVEWLKVPPLCITKHETNLTGVAMCLHANVFSSGKLPR